MDGIDFTLLEEKSKLPIGTSKLFGNPDVWDGFEWPSYVENGEVYDLTFMCQINCEEAAAFHQSGLLPKSGMLYFFYDMDEMPKESVNLKASRVLYYDGSGANLHEMLRTDHEGNDMSLPKMRICFTTPEGEDGQSHTLLGEPFPDEWRPILKINTFETDKVSIKFKNALYFCVKESQLKSRDFSEIFIRQG